MKNKKQSPQSLESLNSRVLKDIREIAQLHDLSKVILFGSRARGDHYYNSDIDLAVKGKNSRRFHQDLEEYAWTLCTFDVVDLSLCSESLKSEIERDGILLYEKV